MNTTPTSAYSILQYFAVFLQYFTVFLQYFAVVTMPDGGARGLGIEPVLQTVLYFSQK